MGDSDDENYVTFGSSLDPLDEENLPRKKAVTAEDQYALDPQGRRRFHGAFTGGFSAGYFNSVGTRDGWRPQQFKSSRSSKAGGVSQRPEDFMDEEDTSEFGIAPTAIRANSDFTDYGRRGTKRERQIQDNDGPIPGVPVLKELIKPVKDTVGVSLLKRMGWRPGQGIGPRLTKREKIKTRHKNAKMKIYGCALPDQSEKSEDSDNEASEWTEDILFAPDDYEPFICNPKDNYFGIGYTGLDRRPVLTSHVKLFDEPSTFKLQDKNRKLSIRGQAFGVGAFEADDDDIYQRDDMSRYDFSLEPTGSTHKSRWSEKKDIADSSKHNCLEGFTPAKNRLEKKKVFEAPALPKDFKPVHSVRKSRFYPPIEPAVTESGRKRGLDRHALSATDRARILEDVPTGIQNAQLPSNGNSSNSVAHNIITRTLNVRDNAPEKGRDSQDIQKPSTIDWRQKLTSNSFISGGVEGNDPISGSLKSLRDFHADNQFLRPFIGDRDKQTRFEKFMEFSKKGEEGEKLEGLQPLSMTEWERQQERGEFEQAARLFERTEVDSTMREKFVESGAEVAAPSLAQTVNEQMKNAARMKMFGKLTRQREIWQPASIVCKRFNIPEPRTGCAVTNDQKKNKKYSVFDSLDFGGIPSRFESATNTAGTSRELDSLHEIRENVHHEEAVVLPRVEGESDINPAEKSSAKLQIFEASYEKIFRPHGPDRIPTESIDVSDDTEARESSNAADGGGRDTDKRNDLAEKKDLFKAIFLSSSENSEDENEDNEEEEDSEVVKSLLIGKKPVDLNVQRNTSPPRGIFAKLDLDNLTKPGKVEHKNGSLKTIEHDVEDKTVSSTELENCESANSNRTEAEILPDMYGPVLPAKNIYADPSASSSKHSDLQRPIFKSVVVTKVDDSTTVKTKGKWVDRSKVKRLKKEKHKHKHKEKKHSKHKHKSKKSKH